MLLITIVVTLRNRMDILSKFVSDTEMMMLQIPRGYEKLNYVQNRGLWGEQGRHSRKSEVV